jgi:hypothetical protein
MYENVISVAYFLMDASHKSQFPPFGGFVLFINYNWKVAPGFLSLYFMYIVWVQIDKYV